MHIMHRATCFLLTLMSCASHAFAADGSGVLAASVPIIDTHAHPARNLLRGSPEEKIFRIARNLRIPAGTTQIQRNAIARGLLRPAA